MCSVYDVVLYTYDCSKWFVACVTGRKQLCCVLCNVSIIAERIRQQWVPKFVMYTNSAHLLNHVTFPFSPRAAILPNKEPSRTSAEALRPLPLPAQVRGDVVADGLYRASPGPGAGRAWERGVHGGGPHTRQARVQQQADILRPERGRG